jgi:hypothetical protein
VVAFERDADASGVPFTGGYSSRSGFGHECIIPIRPRWRIKPLRRGLCAN